MKKAFSLIAIILVFAFSNAQDTDEDDTIKGVFKAGGNFGLTNNEYSINMEFDIAYLWKVNEKFYAGATTAYSGFVLLDVFSNEGDETLYFVPLSASGHYSFHKNYFVGMDLGAGYYKQYSTHTTRYGMGYLFELKLGRQRKITEWYITYKKLLISDNNFDIHPAYINVGLNFKIFYNRKKNQ